MIVCPAFIARNRSIVSGGTLGITRLPVRHAAAKLRRQFRLNEIAAAKSLARATLAALTFLATAILATASSTAQERLEFGPFYVLTNEPDRLYLDGPMADGASQGLLDNLPRLHEATNRP